MKKLLSVMISILLILSVAPLCFADNYDTLVDWDIRVAVPDNTTAVLKGGEYYIYAQHENSIPYVMLRPYRYDDAEAFIAAFTEYMQKNYPDLSVTMDTVQRTVGNKRCYEIDYGYKVSGYDVRDRRIVITLDGLTYMFCSKEIESNGMTIGSMLDDVVAGCEFLGPGADSILQETGTETDWLAAYAPVFETYYSFLNGASPDEIDTTERGDYYFILGETGISYMCMNEGELGYCLKDLDGNGVPELLISAAGSEYYDESLIYDMFTLEEGTPVRVLASSDRVRYYLAADDLILHEGSGGASYNLSVIYVLNGSELELLSGIVMADEECFEIFGDRESIFMDRKPGDRSITRDEYYQIMDEQESQLTLMELIPF